MRNNYTSHHNKENRTGERICTCTCTCDAYPDDESTKNLRKFEGRLEQTFRNFSANNYDLDTLIPYAYMKRFTELSEKDKYESYANISYLKSNIMIGVNHLVYIRKSRIYHLKLSFTS